MTRAVIETAGAKQSSDLAIKQSKGRKTKERKSSAKATAVTAKRQTLRHQDHKRHPNKDGRLSRIVQ